jgi:biopolymer transport protein ExbB
MSPIRTSFAVLAVALLAVPGGVLAQAETTTPPTQASATTPAAAPAPTVSLADAYRREFAFLEAQKRELSQRLAEANRSFEADRARLERENAALEAQVLAARNEAEAAARELVLADQQQEAIEAQSQLLAATFSQAEASLAGHGIDLPADAGYRDANDGERLARIFAVARERLDASARLRTEPGRFFLADGREVSGTLVSVGAVARYGVSPEGAGALAPAGGGAFKLWPAGGAAVEAARALAEGRPVATLGLFLFDNPNVSVERPVEKTFGKWLASGGAIGYVIVVLGLVGVLFAILRAVFLQNAGARVQAIIDAVAHPLAQGRVADAIEACKRYKGSAARVVTAALRNIDRDREHLEDIISESILHESSHLNRFGPYILLIAAVAPLLGLLGTVTGMIQTFDVITEFGTSDPKLLSGGISVALVTTQIGLIVAIPMLLLGNLLNGWAERIKDDMEKAALKVVNLYGDARAAAPRAG